MGGSRPNDKDFLFVIHKMCHDSIIHSIYIHIESLRCLWQTHRLLLRNIPEVPNVGGARDKNGEITSKVKVKKVHTLGIAPLRESSPQKRSSMARVLKGSLSFTCTPTRSSAIGMSHTCLCLPSYGWYSFTDPGGMEG